MGWGTKLYLGCKRGPRTVRAEGLLVRGCHCPWMLGLSVWKGLRMRMMSRPDCLASLVASCTISSLVLLVMGSSRTVPFTVAQQDSQSRAPHPQPLSHTPCAGQLPFCCFPTSQGS